MPVEVLLIIILNNKHPNKFPEWACQTKNEIYRNYSQKNQNKSLIQVNKRNAHLSHSTKMRIEWKAQIGFNRFNWKSYWIEIHLICVLACADVKNYNYLKIHFEIPYVNGTWFPSFLFDFLVFRTYTAHTSCAGKVSWSEQFWACSVSLNVNYFPAPKVSNFQLLPYAKSVRMQDL